MTCPLLVAVCPEAPVHAAPQGGAALPGHPEPPQRGGGEGGAGDAAAGGGAASRCEDAAHRRRRGGGRPLVDP